MAYKNKLISNYKTGQDIRFIQTSKEKNGELLEMEASFRPYSREPLPHYHPAQTEEFKVVAGEITVRQNGKVKVYRAGESFQIPANTVHSMWNHAGQKAVLNWKVFPALKTEYFLETVTGLANDGRTNDEGIPSVFQIALLFKHYSTVFRLSKPGFFVQKMIFTILGPFAKILGYKAVYRRYLD